jgi:hypothetical protein
MSDAPPTTVEDMFVQTAGAVRTDGETGNVGGCSAPVIVIRNRP